MDPVLNEATKILNGERLVYDDGHGYCLRVAREIVSPPLDLDPVNDADTWTFHDMYSFDRVEGNETGAAWARSTQRTLRDEFGLQVPWEERRGGDLVFIWPLGYPQGHVVVLISPDFCLENTHQPRGEQVLDYRFLRLTNVREIPMIEKAEVMRMSTLMPKAA